MDKATHGRLLARAMRIADLSRDQIANLTGRGVRTVSHWTSGTTMPSDKERGILRDHLGPYDIYADLVVFALYLSELSEDRADTVAGFYKKQLREQREGEAPLGQSMREIREQLTPPTVEGSPSETA